MIQYKEAQRLLEEKEAKQKEKELKLAEENAKKYRNVHRDPDNLLKPTSAMLAKKKGFHYGERKNFWN